MPEDLNRPTKSVLNIFRHSVGHSLTGIRNDLFLRVSMLFESAISVVGQHEGWTVLLFSLSVFFTQ